MESVMEPSKAVPGSLEKRHQPNDTERLLRTAPVQPEGEPLPWLPTIGFLFLTVSCVLSIYRSLDDPWTISFVVSAYATLVLFFWCLRRLERLPRDGTAGREERQLKLSIWVLAMVLNAMFSYRVATMLPPAFAVVVWTMAGLTTLAGFYMFFVDREPAAALPASKA